MLVLRCSARALPVDGAQAARRLHKGTQDDAVMVAAISIEPGSPRENAYADSFNGKQRDERLNGKIFQSRKEAKMLFESLRKRSSLISAHFVLGYRPPAPETIAAGPTSAKLKMVR